MGVKEPIEVSKDWLKTADITFKIGRYEQTLYSLEMAAEIAFKAVLLSLNLEVPKVHDIRKIIRTFLAGNKKVPKEFSNDLDEYLSTFEVLLRMRSIVGYGFENYMEKGHLEEEAQKMLSKCSKLVKSSEGAISYIKNNSATEIKRK
jgi:HEPN domain-containing protein